MLLETVDLTDSTLVVAFPALLGTSPFLVLLFALAYSRIPRELLEAAWLEGLSPWRTWRTVALPLARPALFAVAMLAFVFGVRSLSTLEPTLYPVFLSGAVLASLPPVVAFAVAQRALFRGTVGA